MPTADSGIHAPPCHARSVHEMSPSQRSDLYAWASGLRGDCRNRKAVQAMAAFLCCLIERRRRTPDRVARALIDVRIARLLDELEDAGLIP